MNRKNLITASLAAASLMSGVVFAESSDSFSATISLTVPAICKADIVSVSTSATATEVDIKELCNVGGEHKVVLLHSGLKKAITASYNNQTTTIDTTGRTVIASRNGAYHGKRKLIIPHTDGKPVQVFGIYMNRGNYARL